MLTVKVRQAVGGARRATLRKHGGGTARDAVGPRVAGRARREACRKSLPRSRSRSRSPFLSFFLRRQGERNQASRDPVGTRN